MRSDISLPLGLPHFGDLKRIYRVVLGIRREYANDDPSLHPRDQALASSNMASLESSRLRDLRKCIAYR